jgi:hypothetical protein
MKVFMTLAFLLGSTCAMAVGGFECSTKDNLTRIIGNSGSAGTWITGVTIDGVNLTEKAEYTADSLYVGQSSFSFIVMDENYNRTLLQVETVKRGDYASGLSWQPSFDLGADENIQTIACEFTY